MAIKTMNLIRELFRQPAKIDVDAACDEAAKSPIGPLVRVNISAQNRRIRTK
jgi:hypothetical protein